MKWLWDCEVCLICRPISCVHFAPLSSSFCLIYCLTPCRRPSNATRTLLSSTPLRRRGLPWSAASERAQGPRNATRYPIMLCSIWRPLNGQWTLSIRRVSSESLVLVSIYTVQVYPVRVLWTSIDWLIKIVSHHTRNKSMIIIIIRYHHC